MSESFEKHIPVESEQVTALDCLASVTQLSRQQLKQVMQRGAVWLESKQGISRIRRASKKLKKGEILHLYYDAKVQACEPPTAELVADEGDYSIWNKPYGMYSQGSKWGDHCTLYRWAEKHLQPERPAFIVHRLDRATNGLMVLAHRKSVAAAFSRMFEARDVRKRYAAELEGLLELEELPFIVSTVIDNKKAVSRVMSLLQDEARATTHVEIEIETGRKHQIRRQMSGLGHPVRGDRLYGASDLSVDLRLSCIELAFICPLSGSHKSWRI